MLEGLRKRNLEPKTTPHFIPVQLELEGVRYKEDRFKHKQTSIYRKHVFDVSSVANEKTLNYYRQIRESFKERRILLDGVNYDDLDDSDDFCDPPIPGES